MYADLEIKGLCVYDNRKRFSATAVSNYKLAGKS